MQLELGAEGRDLSTRSEKAEDAASGCRVQYKQAT